MRGALFLRFLFDAADSFSRNPGRVRYGWVSRTDTAKALKKILRPSRPIYGQIKEYGEDASGQNALFDWVRNKSYRYPLISVIRHTSLSELAAHQDQLNLALMEVNEQQARESLGLEQKGLLTPQAQDEIDDKASKNFSRAVDNHFSPIRRLLGGQPAVAREVSRELSQAREDPNSPQETDQDHDFTGHYRTLGLRGLSGLVDLERFRPSWVRPPATPIQIREILSPVGRIGPSAGDLAGAAAQRVSQVGVVQDVVSFSQRFFKTQIYDRVRNGLSGLLGRIGGTGAGAGSVAGSVGGAAASGAARAGASLAARAGLAAVPGIGQALAIAITVAPVAKKASKFLFFIIVGIIVLFFAIAYGIVSKNQSPLVFNSDGTFISTPGQGGGGTGGGSCPTQLAIDSNKNPATCKYLNPGIDILDINISSEAVQIYIDKYAGVFTSAGAGDRVEFIRRVDYIVSQAKKAGLNPVIFLGYWKSESLFSTDPETTADLGCSPGQGRKAFEIEVDCAVGLTAEGGSLASRCASPTNPNKNGCTKPIKTFDEFAESYGSKTVDLNNCSHTYNILLEVASELNACRAGGFVSVQPPPASANQQQLHDDILNKFGLDMDVSLPYSYLKWAWEKLWNVSNTRFLELIRGLQNNVIQVIRSDGPYNEQATCTTIRMSGQSSATGQPYPESLFKVVFIHELSHIIENCNSANSGFSKLQDSVPAKEEYLTSYSQNSLACAVTRTDNLKEDYAESVSYYLNPEFPEQDIGICASFRPKDSLNPYNRNTSEIHKQIMTEVLGGSVPEPGTNLAQISCPVIGGGRNRLTSYQADPVNGHCGSEYKRRLLVENNEDVSACTGEWRRAKSVDIETGGPNGKDVELPAIDGQKVDWKYVSKIGLGEGDCFPEEIVDKKGVGEGCGVGYVFKADLGGGKNWVLHLLHMQEANIQTGLTYKSGTILGKGQAIHTHISVGQNIKNVVSQIDDGSPGWLSADTQLRICGS